MCRYNDFRCVALVAILLALALIATAIDYMKTGQVVSKVKNGEWALECKMKDGLRVIDPSKVRDVDPDIGVWYFTNGYAKNCTVAKNNQL